MPLAFIGLWMLQEAKPPFSVELAVHWRWERAPAFHLCLGVCNRLLLKKGSQASLKEYPVWGSVKIDVTSLWTSLPFDSSEYNYSKKFLSSFFPAKSQTLHCFHLFARRWDFFIILTVLPMLIQCSLGWQWHEVCSHLQSNLCSASPVFVPLSNRNNGESFPRVYNVALRWSQSFMCFISFNPNNF